MPATLEAGTILGYSVGEPWNQAAVAKGIGVPVISDDLIWKNNPDKVFGVTKAFADKYPNTHVHLVKALIRAAYWLMRRTTPTAWRRWASSPVPTMWGPMPR